MAETGSPADRDEARQNGASDGRLIDEKRMDEMAVAPPDPAGASQDGAKQRDSQDAKQNEPKTHANKHERGEAPTRADDDGMQIPPERLEDADRDDGNLEDGLEDSMDASDPPSSTQP